MLSVGKNKMTRQEAIRRIKDHMDVHNMYEPRSIKISEALEMAIKSLEQPRLFVYRKPGVLVGHNYVDDVAIVYAKTKEEAMEKFKEFYSDVNSKNVSEPYFNYGGVAILTDY